MSADLLAVCWTVLGTALLLAMTHRIPSQRVFQSAASGLLGAGALHGGWRTTMIGLAIHFVIGISVGAFYGLSLKIPKVGLRERITRWQ